MDFSEFPGDGGRWDAEAKSLECRCWRAKPKGLNDSLVLVRSSLDLRVGQVVQIDCFNNCDFEGLGFLPLMGGIFSRGEYLTPPNFRIIEGFGKVTSAVFLSFRGNARGLTAGLETR